MPSTNSCSAVVSRLSGMACLAVALMSCITLVPQAAPGTELPLPSASGSSQPELAANREVFAKRLHIFAKQKAGQDRSRYFALVRRGMDRFDELASRAGGAANVESSTIDVETLDSTPTDADTNPSAQFLTTLRVGLNLEDDARILGGFPIVNGRFEEVVSLTGNGFLCSGIALDARRVLTAAHCACDLGLLPGPHNDPLAKIKVGLKTDGPLVKQRLDINANATKVFPGNSALDCNNIEAQVRGGRLDLAVIEIAGNGPIQAPTVRIQKPDVFAPSVPRTKQDGPPFFIFGFGCTAPEQVGGRFMGCRGQNSGGKEGGIIFYSINCAPEAAGGFAPDPLLGNPAAICAPDAKEFILSNFFKNQTPTDTCAGDSGGPVLQLAPGDSSANPYRLVGITSRSLHPLGHCGFGGIYTKVSDPKVIKWLTDDVNVNVQ